MKHEGRDPVLKESRWLLLKRSENLGDEQHFRLSDLLRYNLKTVRAYLLKEAFQQRLDYNWPAWAGKFLDEWCRQTMRSRIEPMKKIARSLRQHHEPHRATLLTFTANRPPFARKSHPADPIWTRLLLGRVLASARYSVPPFHDSADLRPE